MSHTSFFKIFTLAVHQTFNIKMTDFGAILGKTINKITQMINIA